MKKKILYLGLVLIFGASGGIFPAAAADVALYDMAFYVDGIFYESRSASPSTDPTTMTLPANLNVSGFNLTTGLGTLVWTTSTPGYHKFLSFFDHEIDEAINSFFNETGKTLGSLQVPPPSPLFWQIDEPGYTVGDIYNEFKNATYENENMFGATILGQEDVSMGIGRDFTLDNNQRAIFTLVLGTTPPPLGVNALWQYDPESDASVFLSESYEVRNTSVTPIPGTLILMVSGLAGLTALRLKLRR